MSLPINPGRTIDARPMGDPEPEGITPEYVWVPIIEGTPRSAIPDIAVNRWYVARSNTVYEVQRRVVTAANIFHLLDGTNLIVPSARHFSPAMTKIGQVLENAGVMDESGMRGNRFEDQGFIDQFDDYLTRREAYIVANLYGRILDDRNGDREELFSEGLH